MVGLMAKVDMKKFEKDMTKILNEVQKPQNMKEIGQIAADRIKVRTQLGRGVDVDGGPSVPLSKLKDSTKKSRKRKKELGDLSGLTSASKSNLTQSGQMLESIKVLKFSQGSAIIGPAGTRDDGKKNVDVAEYAEDGSSNRSPRRFLHLSGSELSGIQREFVSRIENVIKRLLTK